MIPTRRYIYRESEREGGREGERETEREGGRERERERERETVTNTRTATSNLVGLPDFFQVERLIQATPFEWCVADRAVF